MIYFFLKFLRFTHIFWRSCVLVFFAPLIPTLAQPISYPDAESKKGLQVQMVDDAIRLGIHHAALNLDLGKLIEPVPSASCESLTLHGESYHFSAPYLAAMDAQIEALTDAGVIVSLIILVYEPQDPERRRILLHPQYSSECPNRISAFNCITDEGRKWLQATLEFLADRWSGARTTEVATKDPRGNHGQVWNWIIGNEVNSHWFWCNRGQVKMQEFADDYLRMVQLASRAIRIHQPEARIFVSIEHHWNIAYPGGAPNRCFPSRPFLEYLAHKSAQLPDIPSWHVAFHPYPENLFEPRTWLDQSATDDWRTTPRITFRNIELLPQFLREPQMLADGKPRRVILSEQGFHMPDSPNGETIQAAAFCYAWRKIENLQGIDAFIYHRHVDHAHEGGLNLGLWTRTAGSIADPERPKKIYEVFRAAATPDQSQAFAFSKEILPNPSQ